MAGGILARRESTVSHDRWNPEAVTFQLLGHIAWMMSCPRSDCTTLYEAADNYVRDSVGPSIVRS